MLVTMWDDETIFYRSLWKEYLNKRSYILFIYIYIYNAGFLMMKSNLTNHICLC